MLVDGEPADPVGHRQESAAELRFVGAVIGLGDDNGDPTVRLERRRRVDAGHAARTIELVNDARTEVAATVSVRLAADLAPILAFRYGGDTDARGAEPSPGRARRLDRRLVRHHGHRRPHARPRRARRRPPAAGVGPAGAGPRTGPRSR